MINTAGVSQGGQLDSEHEGMRDRPPSWLQPRDLGTPLEPMKLETLFFVHVKEVASSREDASKEEGRARQPRGIPARAKLQNRRQKLV